MHPFEQFDAAGPRGPALPVSEMAVAAADEGTGMVAVLLAVAAILAAIIGWQAASISNAAGDDWQSALRTEVKRAAAAQEDVRFVYENELPVAVRVLQAQVLERVFRSAAQSATGATKLALQVEADTQAQVAGALRPQFELTSNPAYTLSTGALDLAKRLADERSKAPAILALDPDAIQAQGDALARQANLITMTLLPIGVGALFGVLAQPLRRHRFNLLSIGWAGVIAGGALAAAVYAGMLA